MEETKGERITTVSDDSFVLEIMEKDTSRITLQRNLSRKGSARNGEMKINVRDATTSPRATIPGGSTPEKLGVVAVAPTEHPHHQITITKGIANGVATVDSKCVAKKVGSRRTRTTWTSDPKRILVFFATLSSMGTILLIYFTLSMGKLITKDNNASI